MEFANINDTMRTAKDENKRFVPLFGSRDVSLLDTLFSAGRTHRHAFPSVAGNLSRAPGQGVGQRIKRRRAHHREKRNRLFRRQGLLPDHQRRHRTSRARRQPLRSVRRRPRDRKRINRANYVPPYSARHSRSGIMMRPISRLFVASFWLSPIRNSPEAKAGSMMSKSPRRVPAVSTLPFEIAARKGFFRDEGLDVLTITMRTNIAVNALLTRNVDYATPSTSVIKAATGGLPVKLVSVLQGRPDYFLIAKKEIRSIKELKGQAHRHRQLRRSRRSGLAHGDHGRGTGLRSRSRPLANGRNSARYASLVTGSGGRHRFLAAF